MTENSITNKMPYSVPEGYFDTLNARLSKIPQESVKPVREVESGSPLSEYEGAQGKAMAISFWQKFRPYVALAASFAAAIVVGSFIINLSLKDTVPENSYEELLLSDLIPVTEPYLIYGDSSTSASEELTDNDIEKYLIASGTSVELLGYTAYESDY
ncbi:MAG: hypothetical protein WCR48_00140 [Bacteroidales bacterium]